MEGNTFYSIREKELSKFLLDNFTQKTEVNWEEEFVPNFFDINNVELTYINNDSWFFRLELNPDEIYYFFGIKRDDDIFLRLIIKSSAVGKNSALKFFRSGKVLVQLKIKGNNRVIHDYLRDNFDLKVNKKNRSLFYIPLGNSISQDVINTIVRLLNSVACKLDTNLNFLYVTGLINDDIITQKEKKFVFNEFDNELNSFESIIPVESILKFESKYSNNYFNFYEKFNFKNRIVNKNKELALKDFNGRLNSFEGFISLDDQLKLKDEYLIDDLNYYDLLDFEGVISKHNKKIIDGEKDIILKEFKKKLSDRTTFITNSEKIKFKKEYNKDYFNFYDELRFEDLINDFNENHEISVDRIISEIDCNDFQSQPNESIDLISELNGIVESPIFNIIAEGFNEDEISLLIIKIKNDITDQKVSGDIQDIIDFYLEQFNKIKKQYSLNSFLNNYIKSEDFHKLLDLYDEYTEDMIQEIINHVRKDIFDDDLMDKEKIKIKLSYYFKAEMNKNDNYIRLNKIKDNSNYYINEYNINKEEFLEILDFIKIKIHEGHHIKNVDSYLIRKIKEKVDECRNDSRLKLKKLLTNQEFIEKNNISQEQIEYLNNVIGDFIYANQIRSNQITEKFIEKILGFIK